VKPGLLLAEDDRAIRESLTRMLELEGYDVVAACDGLDALAALHGRDVQIIVLDVMMPGIDGVAVCRALRRAGDRTPILMLTARSGTGDRVAGLDAGADDYVPKPFDIDELLARLRALRRRATSVDGDPPSRQLRLRGLVVDPPARRAWCHDVELVLTKTEFDLLTLLVRNAGVVLEHATIYERIWGYDFGPLSKNLAVYVGYLRRKLAAAGAGELVETVRGVGYTVRGV